MPNNTPLSSTTATTMTSSGGAVVLIWLFSLFNISVPPEVSIYLAGIAVLILHFILKVAERWTRVDIDGNGQLGNGHAQTAGEK